MEIRPGGEGGGFDGRTDMTELKVLFSSFANAPTYEQNILNFEEHKHNPKYTLYNADKLKRRGTHVFRLILVF